MICAAFNRPIVTISSLTAPYSDYSYPMLGARYGGLPPIAKGRSSFCEQYLDLREVDFFPDYSCVYSPDVTGSVEQERRWK